MPTRLDATKADTAVDNKGGKSGGPGLLRQQRRSRAVYCSIFVPALVKNAFRQITCGGGFSIIQTLNAQPLTIAPQ
jgi:hypothetical protein